MRREYGGAVPKAAVSVLMGGTTADLTLICDDLSGWPLGLDPFFIIINRGKANEEKLLVENRVGNILTVWSDGMANGRGADGTAITVHQIGEPVEHVFTATDADEANAHVNTGTGAHGYPPIADVVTLTGTQTLANKTMSGASNTFSNIPESAVTNLVSDLAQKTTDLNTHIADTSTHGITSEIVGRTEAQTLTNKTIDYNANTILNLPVTPGPTGPAGPPGADGPPGEIIYQSTAPVSPTNGMVWVDSDAVTSSGGGSSTLAGLTDVVVGTPADNDSLTWDAGTSKWVPQAITGGGGGATGGGTDKVFNENDQVVTTNYTITAGKNASSAGPITINAGVTVTIPSGATWVVV